MGGEAVYMNDEPLWFARIKRYFEIDCSSTTEEIERLVEPRARITTRNGDGLSAACVENLPPHLTILSQEPTREREVIVEYDDDAFDEVDVEAKQAMYDHEERPNVD